jgi:hypothetical protein
VSLRKLLLGNSLILALALENISNNYFKTKTMFFFFKLLCSGLQLQLLKGKREIKRTEGKQKEIE